LDHRHDAGGQSNLTGWMPVLTDGKAMSFQVTDAFVAQFSGNLAFLAQQRETRFRRRVYEQPITGETAYLEQLAPTQARKRQARHADSPIMNTQHTRRRISPYDYEWGDLIDKLDEVRMLIDPTSKYAQNAAYAMMRGIDDEIINGFFATAYTGHTGGTSIVWPAGNSETTPAQPAGTQVAVNDWSYGNGSGNAGLTISKLISAKVALMAAEGDEEEDFHIAVSAKQIGNLLATTEATNGDYNTVKALVGGTITEFMGFKFVRSERLLLNGSSQARCVAWRQSGMGLGVAADVQVELSKRADKGYAWYPYATMAVGAARLEEPKVCEIICA
jgi:hypothetical protein